MKPTTFMNRSGQALTALAALPDFLPEEDLLIVVDDAALEVGRVRFRPQGSPGGHNGLQSVSQALGIRRLSATANRCRDPARGTRICRTGFFRPWARKTKMSSLGFSPSWCRGWKSGAVRGSRRP